MSRSSIGIPSERLHRRGCKKGNPDPASRPQPGEFHWFYTGRHPEDSAFDRSRVGGIGGWYAYSPGVHCVPHTGAVAWLPRRDASQGTKRERVSRLPSFFSHACMACAPRVGAAAEAHVGDVGKNAVDKGEMSMELSFVVSTSSSAWAECRTVNQLPARSCLSHQRYNANVLVPRTRSRILGGVTAIPEFRRHAKVACSRGHGKLILRYRSTRHNAQTVGEGQTPPTSYYGVIHTRSSCKTPLPSAATTPKQTRADTPGFPRQSTKVRRIVSAHPQQWGR